MPWCLWYIWVKQISTGKGYSKHLTLGECHGWLIVACLRCCFRGDVKRVCDRWKGNHSNRSTFFAMDAAVPRSQQPFVQQQKGLSKLWFDFVMWQVAITMGLPKVRINLHWLPRWKASAYKNFRIRSYSVRLVPSWCSTPPFAATFSLVL